MCQHNEQPCANKRAEIVCTSVEQWLCMFTIIPWIKLEE